MFICECMYLRIVSMRDLVYFSDTTGNETARANERMRLPMVEQIDGDA